MIGTASDEKLIKRALGGSNSAWNKLIKRYEKRVYNYALRMVGNPDDAMDLMQEVFVGVHRNLASYRGEGAFPAWLFRIASFRCTDYLRRRRFMDEYDEQTAPSDDTLSPQSLAMATHANAQITEALQQLSHEQRQVVELKFFQAFTFEDIASQLGISPNTAKTRLYSALKKLRSNRELEEFSHAV